MTQEKKTNGKRNRVAGHSYEREVVNALKLIGFEHAATARLVSKYRDDQKIDIVNKDEDVNGRIPYNIQVKCTARKLNYDEELAKLPDVANIINVIFHKQTKKVGERFLPKGQYAFVTLPNFLAMIKSIRVYKEAYEYLHTYFDSIPDEEKKEADKYLKSLGL
jgi:hypothetical protein